MANLIQVRQGSTPVPAAAWKRVTVLGGGAPVWEKLATLGIPQDRKPKVAVTLYTDECTGDQQPIENNNIAAVESNNGRRRWPCSLVQT